MVRKILNFENTMKTEKLNSVSSATPELVSYFE
jgi:hypothetical protein